jgi:hypothetical protein
MAWALLRHFPSDESWELSGVYMGIGEAEAAASGLGAEGRWGSWRECREDDAVSEGWVLPGEKAAWYIVGTEVHPARGWWAVQRAVHLVRDCLRAIRKGGTR